MNRTQIYLPKTQLDALRRTARKERTTVSHVVRRIVADQFEKNPRSAENKRQETLVDFARRIAKIGRKGPRDLASHMDAYLYGGKR
jgi:hypothetical protein